MGARTLTPKIYTDLYTDLTQLIQDIEEYTSGFDPLYGGSEAKLAVMKLSQGQVLLGMALVEIGALPNITEPTDTTLQIKNGKVNASGSWGYRTLTPREALDLLEHLEQQRETLTQLANEDLMSSLKRSSILIKQIEKSEVVLSRSKEQPDVSP